MKFHNSHALAKCTLYNTSLTVPKSNYTISPTLHQLQELGALSFFSCYICPSFIVLWLASQVTYLTTNHLLEIPPERWCTEAVQPEVTAVVNEVDHM